MKKYDVAVWYYGTTRFETTLEGIEAAGEEEAREKAVEIVESGKVKDEDWAEEFLGGDGDWETEIVSEEGDDGVDGD